MKQPFTLLTYYPYICSKYCIALQVPSTNVFLQAQFYCQVVVKLNFSQGAPFFYG